MAYGLREAGLDVVQQRGFAVRYEGIVAGQYFVDLMVEQVLPVEMKIASTGDEGHRGQCLNALKQSDLRLCLELELGKSRLEIERGVNGP